MSVFGRDEATYDPANFERSCISERSHDLASFAEMVAKLVDMRQDDRAHAMFGAVLDEVVHLKKHFTELGRKLQDEASPSLETMRQRANIAMEDANRRRMEDANRRGMEANAAS